ncbi:MAG: hypothetical protein ABIO58_04600 [Luteimonas sp.]
MKKSLVAASTITLLLSMAPMAAPVEASSAIQRCQSADGTLVYTDKACAVFGARAAPMSAGLLTRIAREEAKSQDASLGGDAAYADANTPLDNAIATASRRSPSSGCARTPTQLAMDLRGALVLGDVNRVAESYHWVGMSSRQGERTLDRLQHLIGKPVVDSHYFDARISMSPSYMPDAATALVATTSGGIGGDAGMLQLVLGDGGARSVVDFDVHKYAGCYFVKF